MYVFVVSEPVNQPIVYHSYTTLSDPWKLSQPPAFGNNFSYFVYFFKKWP